MCKARACDECTSKSGLHSTHYDKNICYKNICLLGFPLSPGYAAYLQLSPMVMLHAPASCNTAHRVFSCNKQKRGPQYILCSQLEMSAALDDVCDTTAHPTQLPARTGTPDSAPVLPYLSGAAPPPGTRSAARSACTRRQKDASSLRVLVLIGVACAFCAAFNPRMTKVAMAARSRQSLATL